MAPLMALSQKKKLFLLLYLIPPPPPPTLHSKKDNNKKQTNKIKVEIIYFDLAALVTANAKFIIWAIDFSFESISFES